MAFDPPTYALPEPPWELHSNFVPESWTATEHHRPSLVPVGQALTSVVNSAFALRLLHNDFPDRHGEFLNYWQWVWCKFLDSIYHVAAIMPESAKTLSALGTSAEDILMEDLPQSLQPVLHGIVAGKRKLEQGHLQAQNISLISLQHLECAMVLGDEVLEHGFSRVGKAEFHGNIRLYGVGEFTVHRADAILSALTGHLGSASATPRAFRDAPLRIAEIGVHYGDFAYRILNRHPTLAWLGVDPYECGDDSDFHRDLARFRKGLTGSQVLRAARKQLRPWLGTRAQLLVARSTDVTEAEVGEGPVDVAFIDAIHDEDHVIADIEFWSRFVRPGGLVAGHDYGFGNTGVVEGVHKVLPKGCTLHLAPNAVYWWLRAPDSSGISC